MLNQEEIIKQRVCVIGMGYVGLTLGLTLSDLGFPVIGVEKSEEAFNKLKNGKTPFYESGLEELLRRELARGFELRSDLAKSLADVYIFAIGTPVRGERKTPDFNDLNDASHSVGSVLKRNDLVILRSTVPPGTTRDFVIPRLEKSSGLKAGQDFYVAFAPERTIEGRALEELRYLPQVVGGFNEASREAAAEFFSAMTSTIVRVPSFEAAEMTKLINNLYRDVTFAFANEIALVCDKFNLDASEVIEAANAGYERGLVPKPSPGVGGYCLTKDPHILRHALRGRGLDPRLIMEARNVNKYMPHYVGQQISKFVKSTGKKHKEIKVFILGLAFKGDPPTSDLRYSPALKLARILREKSFDVYGYDPVISADEAPRHGVNFVSLEEGFRDADAVVFATNHHEFRNIDILKHLTLTRKPVLVFDGWKFFNSNDFGNVPGVKYSSLGYNNILL